MTSMVPQHFAPLGAHRLREGDLVGLCGDGGTFRVRTFDHRRRVAELAHMSGKPAGKWPVALVTPLAGGRP